MGRFRVGIVGLLQESNTFIPSQTRRSDFEADLLLKGEDIRARMQFAPHEVGGFFGGLADAGIEAVPIFLARALPYGVIRKEDFEDLVEEMLESLREAGELDGLLAAPHGATVAEGYPDADGYWLSQVRQWIGHDVPVMASLDPHANLTPAMIEATDAIIAYSTNPHLDQRETGIKVAELMSRTLAGDVRPVQAAAFPPMAINIQCQNTATDPLRSLYSSVAQKLTSPGILSGSLILGFPYADVIEMGSAVLVVADRDLTIAQRTADQLGRLMWDQRTHFEPEFVNVETAVSIAGLSPDRPVVLLDMGDNVGGGSPANSTTIVHAWLKRGCRSERAFACLFDPVVAKKATDLGAAAVYDGPVGDPSNPVTGRFTIESLHDGKFVETTARHGGFSAFDQGITAVLRQEGSGLTLMVTERRMAPFSLSQLTSFGIDPAVFDFIIAKGVIAPMAAYEPVAKGGFLHVDSPGVTRANMTKLIYQNRRRPLYPFEKD